MDIVQSNTTYWLRARKDTTAAIVFVHGINSCADKCWRSGQSYWPSMLIDDPRYRAFDVVAPDYFTGLGSADYGISDCAAEMLRTIESKSTPHGRSLFQYKIIIFVAHSFGGIITRYLIESHREAFNDKTVGLLLMASPSHGSVLADAIKILTGLVRHKQRDELSIVSPILDDLDIRFKRLVHSDNPKFALHGIEAYEQKRLFGLKKIVTRKSATPYFGEAVHIPRSTHSSIVKPTSVDHPSYLLLTTLCERYFASHYSSTAQHTEPQVMDRQKLAVFDVYTPACEEFYFQRPIDGVAKNAIHFRSLWLHGYSGVGKTSIARRISEHSSSTICNVYLANCDTPVAEKIKQEIEESIREHLCNLFSLPLSTERSSPLAIIKSAGSLTIFLDEIPIGENASENFRICEAISNFLHELKSNCGASEITVLAASLKKPHFADLSSPSKFSEHFQVLHVPSWSSEDLGNLAALIDTANISQKIKINIQSFVDKKFDNPRDLKNSIRDELIQRA